MMESVPSVWFSRLCVIACHLSKFMLCTSASGHQKYPVDLTRPPQVDLKVTRSSLKCVIIHAYSVPRPPGGHIWAVILPLQTWRLSSFPSLHT